MKSFFTKKYFKVPIVAIVIVSLLLQFIPAPKPAKAFDPMDILRKIFDLIQIPSELELTSDGSIEFGSWLSQKHWGGSGDASVFNCLFKKQPEASGSSIDLKFCGCQARDGLKCGWRDNNDCRADCPNRFNSNCGGTNAPCCVRPGEECVNPFSTFRFGHHESQTALKTKEGHLTIPNPKIPSRCQLRIPLPDEDDTTSIEEKLAERKACNYLRSVQQAAAQAAYTAKKIFNNTDPLSDCFFLRNCKTSCSFRFGSVAYTITLLDIVRLFVGDVTVVLSAVQKIINLVKIFQAILELGGALKDLYHEGVSVVSDLLDTVRNLATLGSSLQELGVKISDAFVFTPPAIATGETEERVKKAYSGFVDLISNFAGNLEKYQLAKSEALALAEQTKEDVEQVMEKPATVTFNPSSPNETKVDIKGFKNEPEIGFLFVKQNTAETRENYEKKRKLDEIVADYQTMFQPISTLIERIAILGDMFDGQSFAFLEEGTEDEWWEKSRDRFQELCCGEGYPGSGEPCSEKAIWYERDVCKQKYWYYVRPETSGAPEQARRELVGLVENQMSDDIRANFSTDRRKYIYMEGRLLTKTYIPQELDLATRKIVFDEKFFEDFCADPDSNPATDDSCWRQEAGGEFCNVWTFKGDRVVSQQANYAVQKTSKNFDSDYIRRVIESALDPNNSKNEGDKDKLDRRKPSWRVYWEELARLIMGSPWVANRMDKEAGEYLEMDDRHEAMIDNVLPAAPELTPVAHLDSRWADSVDNELVNQQLAEYGALGIPDLGSDIGTKKWFETFQEIFKDVDGFKVAFRLLAPNYIKEEVIGSALGVYDCPPRGSRCKFAYEKLNYKKDSWRVYWEQLARFVQGNDWVDARMDKNSPQFLEMEQRHQTMLNTVTDALSVLGPIAVLNNKKFNKEDKNGDLGGFYGPRIIKAFEGGTITDPVTGVVTEVSGYNELFEEVFNMRYDQIGKIETIKHNIDILASQEEDLHKRWEGTPPPPNDYWESRIWCNRWLDIKPQKQYKESYEGAVVDNDWEKRIGLIADSKDDLDIIKDALFYRLGPSQPLLVYYITRAQNKLVQLAELFQETIQKILCGTDMDCDREAQDEDNGLQGEISDYCAEDAKNTPAFAEYRRLLRLHECYKDGSFGSDTCEDVPVSCESCNSTCNTSRCSRAEDEKCYERSNGNDKCRSSWSWSECREDCEDHYGEGSDCDDECWRHTEDSCFTDDSATSRCYGHGSNAVSNCKDGCKDIMCEDSQKPCWLRDDYKRRYEEELEKLGAECQRRLSYARYLSDELSNIDFTPMIKSFEENFEPLKAAVKGLQNIWEKRVTVGRESAVASSTVHKIISSINESIKIVDDILPEIDAALTNLSTLDQAEQYLNKGYCDDSDSCTKALADVYRCGVGEYQSNKCAKVSTKTWNKLLLNDPDNPDNSGILVRFKKEVETAKRQIADFIKIKAGTYSSARYPQLDEFGNTSFPAGCPDEDTGNLFLNRIRCFEDENDRDFYQLPNFINVVEALENMGFAMDDLKENIIDLEPSIDMEVVDGLKDKLEAIGENPITLLDDTFQAIRNIFINISSLPLSRDISAFLNEAWREIGNWNVFGNSQKSRALERRDAYRNAIENLHQENITDLRGLIFAEDDVTKGCQALSMVLNSDPRETRDNCLAQKEFFAPPNTLIGTEIDDFNDVNSQQGCRALGELDLGLFTEDAEEEREELIAEKETLEAQRSCIRKITCNNPTLDSCITCPEWICEGIDDPYCIANDDRKVGMAVWQTDPNKPGYVLPADRVWPPYDPCQKGELDYKSSMAKGYTGSQTLCIQKQKDVGLYKSMLGEDEGSDFDWVTKELIDNCDQLAIQKSLKKECEHFEMLENNVFPGACNKLSHCSSNATDAYQAGRVVAPCEEYCTSIKDKAWGSFCVVSDEAKENGIEPVLDCQRRIIRADTMPNLTLPTPDNKPIEELSGSGLGKFNDLQEQRRAVIERCNTAAHNIQKPLDEIMKIFAILLGIKSATGLYSGVQILKSSTQKIIKDVKDFIKIIKGSECKDGSECDCGQCKGDGSGCSGGIIKDIQCLWNQIDEGLEGGDQGLEIKALQCESHPAVSYSTTKDRKLTSNQGGPVCPGVGELFQQVEGQFGLTRQNTRQIDLVRRGVKEGGFSIGRLNLHLWDEYPIVYHSFDDLYEVAKNIKTRTSYVWALANAVNFANKQCSCGQSYCKMPLCMSGLPLAFAPVKNPYCYIVWLFRHPMKKVAEDLGKVLETQFK